MQFGEVAYLRVCDGQLHEGGEREEARVVPETERGGYGCIAGKDGVRLVDDVLERWLCEVGAVALVDERACSQQAVPPGVLRLPAVDAFLGSVDFAQLADGGTGGLLDACDKRGIHSGEEVGDFEEPVVECARVNVLCGVGAVGEQLLDEGLCIDILPELVAFGGVGGCAGVVELAPVERADERHVALARDHLGFDLRELRAELADERCHAHDAAPAGARVRLHVRRDFLVARLAVLEHVGEVPGHALRDAHVLVHAYLREVAGAGHCLALEGLRECVNLFAEGSERVCRIGLGECLGDVLVFVGAVVVAAAVPAVMADVEGLVACGRLGVLDVCGFRVGHRTAEGVFRVSREFGVGRLRLCGECREGEYN